MEEDRSPQDQDEKEDRKQVIVRKRPGQTPDGMRACRFETWSVGLVILILVLPFSDLLNGLEN